MSINQVTQTKSPPWKGNGHQPQMGLSESRRRWILLGQKTLKCH